MRDPERIDRVLEKVRRLWVACPDLRLGQLVSNAGVVGAGFGSRTFYVEDDAMERGLDIFLLGAEAYGVIPAADLDTSP